MNAVLAEVRKAATLPGVLAGLAVALAGSIGLALLNGLTARNLLASGRPDLLAEDASSPFETAFAAIPLGAVGAVIIGVVVISSEYATTAADAGGGRQLSVTLAAVPGRTRLLMAKAATVVLFVVVTAAIALPASIALARSVLGVHAVETVPVSEMLGRCLGAALYWALSGLIALAIASLTRSGVIPLIVLIVNGSLVSVSYLLTQLTPVAHWLPDMAGRSLFAGPHDAIEGALDALPGALVMIAWTIALLAVAGVVLTRRDA